MHPQRAELREVVLVRQTELACRNSWDQDLWIEADNPVLGVAATAASGGIVPDPDILYDVPASGPLIENSDTESTKIEAQGQTDRVTNVQVPAPRNGGLSRPRPLILSSQTEGEDIEASWPSKSAVHNARRRLEVERRRAQQQQQESQITDISRRIASADVQGTTGTPPLTRTLPPQDVPRPVTVGNGHAHVDPLMAEHQRSAPDVTLSPPVARTGYASPAVTPPIATPPMNDRAVADVSQETEQLPTRDVRIAIGDAQAPPGYAASPTSAGNGPVPFVYVDGAVRPAAPIRNDGPARIDLRLAEPDRKSVV